MADFKKIIESIPKEYQKQKKVDGVLRNTYFFARWVGYQHPVIVDEPLTYAETQNRGDYGYVEASLDTSGKVPLIILIESLAVKREPVKIAERQLGKQHAGEVYYLFYKKDDRLILDKEVKLDDTFGVKEYVHIVFDEKGNIAKSEIANKKCSYSYAYEYDKKGLLLKVIMKNIEGTKILERGKEF